MRDFDVVVVGAGVAGLTAAMVAARNGLQTVVVDRMGVGGQISTAERIENFPGFPQGIAGHELGPLLHEQADATGAEFILDTVEALEISAEHRLVHCTDNGLRARAVIIAAGSTHRTLSVPGEDRFLGRGVSHCASCDGPLFAGEEVAVVGGGDTALDEALVLAEHAARVTIVHRGADLTAQQALRERAGANPKLTTMLETVVEEIIGDTAVAGVRLRARTGTATRIHPVKGVFIAIGLEPNIGFLRGLLTLDAAGHVETDIMMCTSVAGIFAAGDVRKDSVALLAASAGDGATAAMAAVRYLAQSR